MKFGKSIIIGNLTLISYASSQNVFSLQGNSQRIKEKNTFLNSNKTDDRTYR